MVFIHFLTLLGAAFISKIAGDDVCLNFHSAGFNSVAVLARFFLKP